MQTYADQETAALREEIERSKERYDKLKAAFEELLQDDALIRESIDSVFYNRKDEFINEWKQKAGLPL